MRKSILVFLREIKGHYNLFRVALFVFFIYDLLSLFYNIYTKELFLKNFVRSFLIGEIIFLLLLLLVAQINKILGWFFLFISLFFSSLFWYIISQWGLGGLTTRFHVIWESTPTERHEFITLYLLTAPYFYFSSAIFIMVLYLFYIERGRGARLYLRNFFVILILLFFVLFGSIFLGFAPIHPTAISLLSLYKSYKDVTIVHRRIKWLQSTNINSSSVDCSTKFDKIVIFINESVNRDWMQIYTSKVKTTPALKRVIKQHPSLVIRAISPGNLTRLSLPILLTEATVSSPQDFEHSLSIISYLNLCGYQTIWLSNQELVGQYTIGSYSIGLEADILQYTQTLKEGHFSQLPYDGLLVNLLKRISINRQKQAFVFHFLGSHWDYRKRYPPVKSLFWPPATIEEDYQNSIYYSDIVVSEILHYFNKHRLPAQKWLFIFVADHGEVVTQTLHGHGFSPSFQEEFRAPLVIWSNDIAFVSEIKYQIERDCKFGAFNLENFTDIIKAALRDTRAFDNKNKERNYCSPYVLALGQAENYFEMSAATIHESPLQEVIIYENLP